MSLEDFMMSLPPCMGGKRPRSPVEKLADLQGQAEAEDEDNWRNSKRYLSEVIANGFSRLNFGLQRSPGSEQQQLDAQMLSLASPRGPGGCYIQLPGGMLSPRDGGDWDMEMDSPPGCPGSSSSAGNAAAATGQRTSRSPSGKGNRPIIVTEMLAGQPGGSPMCSPAGGDSASSPGQYPFGSYVSPGAKPLPPPAWQIAAGAARAAAGTAGAAGATPAAGTASPALPKGLKAAEKAPNSPSDLPAAGSNLRKVALLRSLLARTEQHLQQQQQQQQQHGQLAHEQQHGHQQHEQQAHAAHQQAPGSLQQQHHEQQWHQYGPTGPVVCEQGAAAAEGVHAGAAAQHGCAQQPVQHGSVGRQGLVAAAAAAAPAAGAAGNITGAVATAYQQAACSTHSDDMECSSSSMCDSDSDAHQPRGRVAASASDADLATSSLLCTEVLPLTGSEMPRHRQQQQQQQQSGAWLQHNLAACEQPQQQQHSYVAGCDPAQYGAQLPSHMGQHVPWVQPQQQQQLHMVQQGPHQQLLQHSTPQQGQQQQQQQLRPLELSAERLQQLRAKALASTSRLTELEPEDLASLQLSISASQARRGSADHTPSHLHSARAAAEARRHSSHI